MDTLLLVSSFKEVKVTASHLICQSMIISELFVTGVNSIISLINLSETGYAVGELGCLCQSSLTLLAEGLSILSLIGLTVDRYYAVIFNIYITKTQVKIALAALWTLSPTITLLLVYAGSNGTVYRSVIGLDSSKYICSLAYWSREPFSLVMVNITLFFIAIGLFSIFYAYSAIFMKYYALRKDLDKKVNTHLSTRAKTTTGTGSTIHRAQKSIKRAKSIFEKKSGIFQKDERSLLIRSISLTGSYFICWMPTLIKIIIEVTSGNAASAPISTFCNFFLALYSLLSMSLLIIFDGRVKTNLRRLLWPKTSYNMEMSPKKSKISLKKSREDVAPKYSAYSLDSIKPERSIQSLDILEGRGVGELKTEDSFRSNRKGKKKHPVLFKADSEVSNYSIEILENRQNLGGAPSISMSINSEDAIDRSDRNVKPLRFATAVRRAESFRAHRPGTSVVEAAIANARRGDKEMRHQQRQMPSNSPNYSADQIDREDAAGSINVKRLGDGSRSVSHASQSNSKSGSNSLSIGTGSSSGDA